MTLEFSPPVALNHVAYPTWDSQRTYDFYTGVLGCRFLGAIQLDTVPSTGAKTPYLHTFYGFASGEAIAFFEVDGMAPAREDGIPDWVRHLAVSVASMEDLEGWLKRLFEREVETLGIIDHDGMWYSIYFFDPNGVRLELTYQARDFTVEDQRHGLETLTRWTAAHAGVEHGSAP